MLTGASQKETNRVSLISVAELSPGLEEVVTALDSNMPEGSSAIVQITSSLSPHHLTFAATVSKILLSSPEITGYFLLQEKDRRHGKGGHKDRFMLSPVTWLAGDFDPEDPTTLKHGLFTYISGFYDSRMVCSALGLPLPKWQKDLHSKLEVKELTGRESGSVSVILERQYLEGCSVIFFQTALVEDLKLLNTFVEYPLGANRFYVARGEAFLKGYSALLKNYGIPSNLQPE